MEKCPVLPVHCTNFLDIRCLGDLKPPPSRPCAARERFDHLPIQYSRGPIPLLSPVGSLALFLIQSARQPSSPYHDPSGHAEMRLAFLTILIWLWQLYEATAIQKSLAGVVDWHKALIGVPRLDLEPSFQRIPALNGSDATQDVIVTATDHNILAVLDPADGSIGKCSVTIEYACI